MSFFLLPTCRRIGATVVSQSCTTIQPIRLYTTLKTTERHSTWPTTRQHRGYKIRFAKCCRLSLHETLHAPLTAFTIITPIDTSPWDLRVHVRTVAAHISTHVQPWGKRVARCTSTTVTTPCRNLEFGRYTSTTVTAPCRNREFGRFVSGTHIPTTRIHEYAPALFLC